MLQRKEAHKKKVREAQNRTIPEAKKIWRNLIDIKRRKKKKKPRGIAWA